MASPVLITDFTQYKNTGLQYKVIKDGTVRLLRKEIELLSTGGYTIGYYGRPFQVRNGLREVHLTRQIQIFLGG